MRADGDYRSSEDLTAAWCNDLHRLPDMAWDDRVCMLAQWADMGVQPVAVDQNEY